MRLLQIHLFCFSTMEPPNIPPQHQRYYQSVALEFMQLGYSPEPSLYTVHQGSSSMPESALIFFSLPGRDDLEICLRPILDSPIVYISLLNKKYDEKGDRNIGTLDILLEVQLTRTTLKRAEQFIGLYLLG